MLPGAGLTPRLAAASADRIDGDAPNVMPGSMPGVLPGVSMKPLLCSSLAVGAATLSAVHTLPIMHCALSNSLVHWRGRNQEASPQEAGQQTGHMSGGEQPSFTERLT